MAASLNIIVVEDHDSFREATVSALQAAGHTATGLFAAEDMVELPIVALPDVYVLDLNLPGEDGISLCRRLRFAHPQVGIVMITASNSSSERTTGYKSGADIYLAKPVELEEFLAAVEALGRRVRSGSVAAPALRLNTTTLQLSNAQSELSLSLTEARLLAGFSRASEGILERWQAMDLIGNGKDIGSANLEVRLSGLRKKLAVLVASDNPIRPIRGLGYKLCLPIQLVNSQELPAF